MTGQIISIGAAAGVLLLLLGWRIWRMFCPRTSWLDQPMVFFGLVFTAILALHLPDIGIAREFNVDESQLVAQGLRYLSHPMPWRDVDGTTSGPLDSWVLSVPIFFGAPPTWATARVVLWAIQCATLIFIYLALRCFATRPEAQTALMPTIFFYAFTLWTDYICYSSETLPVLLTSMMVWLLCRAWTAGTFSNASICLTGFLAGCMPFAKLQGTPLAAFLGVLGLTQIIFLYRKNYWTKTAWLCFGAVIFPALLLGVVLACGAGNDFWKSYILAPAAYARENRETKMRALRFMVAMGPDFPRYLVSGLASGILLAATRACAHGRPPDRKLFWPLTAILALGLVAVFCMMAPGKGFDHYSLLMIPALSVFFGLVLTAGKAMLLAAEGAGPKPFPKPIRWFLAGFALIISLQAAKLPLYFKIERAVLARQEPEKKSFIARRILKASQPGDTMSVWGWMPSYYVETGLIPATRDAIGHFVVEAGPYQNYYQQRYLRDLKQSNAAIFVDAMADGVFTWMPPKFKQHESFPELAKFIAGNYSLWLTVNFLMDKGPGIPVRVYLRRQRMGELRLTPEEMTISPNPSLGPE